MSGNDDKQKSEDSLNEDSDQDKIARSAEDLRGIGEKKGATKVARPVTNRVAIKVALRPMRSPQWPKIAAPIGRPTKPMKNTLKASSTPTSGVECGK